MPFIRRICPRLQVRTRLQRNIDFRRKVVLDTFKSTGGNADNRKWNTFDIERLAECRKIMTEPRAPIGITYYGGGRVRLLVFRVEHPAKLGPHTQAREEIPAHHVGPSFFWIIAVADRNTIEAQRHVGHQIREDSAFRAQLLEYGLCQ